MGYTHYIERPKTLSKMKFKKVAKDVKTLMDLNLHGNLNAGGIYKDSPCIIAGPMGQGKSIVTEDLIAFNGLESVSEDLSHESFYLEREAEEIMQFTKTNRKPYDILVCMSMLSLKHHFGEKVTISSDGGFDDWKQAIELYEHTTGRKVDNSFLT